MKEGYDIIGDVHGHADKLTALLKKLGYEKVGPCYTHSERRVIFLGDLIDRGPENFKTLKIAREMVANDRAFIVMGNHEYNALCYHTRDENGRYLRPHTEKNDRQHEKVLAEIEAGGKETWQSYLDWFREMPLFLDLDGLRVVHACWDPKEIMVMKQNGARDNRGHLTRDFLVGSSTPGTTWFDSVETLLKGKEIPLPAENPGVKDKDGNLRKMVRVKWWLPRDRWQTLESYGQVARINEASLQVIKHLKIPADILEPIRAEKNAEPRDNRPIFFGHYWFTGTPGPTTPSGACLDYSMGKGGKLVCYRWDGERILDPAKFTWV